MTRRKVLIVESDAQFASQISQELSRYDLEVELLDDGNQVISAVKNSMPSLILLCIELSKMSGYSICNKLKKSGDLKNIPLIIMSSEATVDIFDQHKRLKTRAEEYMLKPFSMEGLRQVVDRLIGLPALSESKNEGGEGANADGGGGEMAAEELMETPLVDVASEEEVAQEVADDDVELDAEAVIIPEDSQEIFVDSQIDLETDMAFAALEIKEEEMREPPTAMVQSPPDMGDEGGADKDEAAAEKSAAAPEDAGPEIVAESNAAPSAPGDEAPLITPALAQFPEIEPDSSPAIPILKRVDLSNRLLQPDAPEPEPENDHDGEVKTATLFSMSNFARANTEDTSRRESGLPAEPQPEEPRWQDSSASSFSPAPSLTATGAGAGTGSHTFSRDRELLGLREVINKKEKDILDLKDDLDAKERQILDHKDKVRELERKARNMEEKLLSVEKEMVGAAERVSAMQKDKAQFVERERSLKQRLEEAKKEIDKAYVENDGLKKKFKEAQDKFQVQLQVEKDQAAELARSSLREEFEAEKAVLVGEKQHIADELEREKQRLEREKQAALEQATAEREQQINELRASQALELTKSDERHNQTLVELRADLELQLSQQQEEARRREEELQRELEELRSAFAEKEREIERLQVERDAQRAELTQLTQQHTAEIEEKDRQWAIDKDRQQEEKQNELHAQSEGHAAELQHLRNEQAAEMQRLREAHEAELDKRRDEHLLQLDDLRVQAASEKAELEGTLAELEREHGTQQKLLEATEQKLADTRARLQDLEEEKQRLIEEETQRRKTHEEQLSRAVNKIRNDEQLADKAKRAMAIAITLLDEQKKLMLEQGDNS